MPATSGSPSKRDTSRRGTTNAAQPTSKVGTLAAVAIGIVALALVLRTRGNDSEPEGGVLNEGTTVAANGRAGRGANTDSSAWESANNAPAGSGKAGRGESRAADGPTAGSRREGRVGRGADTVTGGLTRRRGLGPSTGSSAWSDDTGAGDGSVAGGAATAGGATAGKLGGRAGHEAGTGGGQEVAAGAATAREPNEPVISMFNETKDQAIPDDGSILNKGVTTDDEGARFPKGSEFAMPVAGLISGDSGTISFAMRPDQDLAKDDNASLLQLRSRHVYENRLQLWQSGTNMNLVLADETGTEHGIQFKSEAWPKDEWRQVTVVWGDGQGELYVNGVLAGTTDYTGSLKILPDTQLHLGSNYPEDPGGDAGVINRFKVYDRALTQDEVAGLTSQATR